MDNSVALNNSAIGAQAAATSTTKPVAKAAQSEVSSKKLAADFDSFLLLLTTQLKNQDPTDPLDTNEFTSQLVAFAGVEQQIDANKNLEKLVGASVNAGVQQGLGYIGKTVEALGDNGVLEDGKAYFAYELPSDVSEATVNILDKGGKIVFSGKGNTQSGKTVAFWDGKNSFNGSQMADGTYKLVVNAKGFKNEVVAAKTFSTGRVSGVETNKENEVVLSIGTAKVKLTDVISVREQPSSVNVANNQAATN
jgi:flagellar basal-body rod modification protein FlgD